MKRSVLLFLSVVLAAILLPAAPGNAAPDPGSQTSALAGALADSRSARPATDASAHSSRRRPPKLMSFSTASNQARRSALDVYLSPEFNFDDYGTGKCYRLSRSRVSCYTWVSEDYFDEYGYYSDTMICDWFTESFWTWNRRLSVKSRQIECVWSSEV